MEISPPTDDELKLLRAEHAQRFPRIARPTLVGDGGRPVQLTFLVANPTDSGEPKKDGSKPSAVWSTLCAIGLQLKDEPTNFTDKLARDCVLWPDAKTLGAYVKRWPGISKTISDVITRKIGLSRGAVEDPDFAEDPPAAIAAVLEQHPRACWRRLKPSTEKTYDIVIEAPSDNAWRLFQKAIAKPDQALWGYVHEMASGCTLACQTLDTAIPVPIVAVYEEFPMVTQRVVMELGRLLGVTRDVEMGE